MSLLWDYSSVRTRLINRLKSKSDNEEILFHGTNARMIDAVAEEFQELARTDEYYLSEAKWTPARNYSSLLAQAEFYNYKARRKTGAFGDLKISTNSNFAGDYASSIDIPKYSTFSNKDISFVSKEDRVLSPGQNYISIDIVQGVPKTYTFEITSAQYPNGTDYVELVIDNDSIENNVYDVYVNGILWTEYDHIRLAEDGNTIAYVLKNKIDFSGIILKFGNDVFGKKLEIGDEIVFKCIETDGKYGNVLSSNVITKVESSFVDTNSVAVTLYCTNEEEISGGDDYETIAEIKVNAPRSYQTGDRAINRNDYIVIINRTGLVDKVNVWGEKETNEDLGNPPGTYIAQEENLVYISAFNIDPISGEGTTITAAQQSEIRSTLNPVKGPTDIVQFVDTEFLGVVFNSTIYVTDKSYTLEQVRSNVDNDLQEKYSLENVDHKHNLYFSDYYRLIDEAAGVNHHRTELSFNLTTKFDSAYVFSLDLNINNIKEGSVEIYLQNPSSSDDWFLIAEDDGSTNLIGTNIDPDDPASSTYELPGAQINYADGYGGDIIVTYGLNQDYTNYNVRIDFELDESVEGDLLLTKRQQIFHYYDSNLTMIAEYVED